MVEQLTLVVWNTEILFVTVVASAQTFFNRSATKNYYMCVAEATPLHRTVIINKCRSTLTIIEVVTTSATN